MKAVTVFRVTPVFVVVVCVEFIILVLEIRLEAIFKTDIIASKAEI